MLCAFQVVQLRPSSVAMGSASRRASSVMGRTTVGTGPMRPHVTAVRLRPARCPSGGFSSFTQGSSHEHTHVQRVQSLTNTNHLFGNVMRKGVCRGRIFGRWRTFGRAGRTAGTGVGGRGSLSEGCEVDGSPGFRFGVTEELIFSHVSSLSSERRHLHQTHLSLPKRALCEQGKP